MKRYHWSAGMLFSGVTHVLFFVYLLSGEAEPVSGSAPGGEGGIVVALAYPSGESGHGEVDKKRRCRNRRPSGRQRRNL